MKTLRLVLDNPKNANYLYLFCLLPLGSNIVNLFITIIYASLGENRKALLTFFIYGGLFNLILLTIITNLLNSLLIVFSEYHLLAFLYVYGLVISAFLINMVKRHLLSRANNTINPENEKTAKYLMRFLLSFGIALVILIAFAYSSTRNFDYYNIGQDNVASITRIVGQRNFAGYSLKYGSGVHSKTYKYKSTNCMEDVIAYGLHLKNNEGFAFKKKQGSDTIEYYKNSLETGKVFVITIRFDENNYSINLRQEKQNELHVVY